MTDLVSRRRAFAAEIEAAAKLRTPALVEALAVVAREYFLPPGPWLIRGERDVAGPRSTPDADPSHVYDNCSIAIDATRQLYNGAPGIVCASIDALNLSPGSRVLHIGGGLGYYSAMMAHVVGSLGRVLVIEVDEQLASSARANLESIPWVETRHGDGKGPLGESFDAILVNAGVTHPQLTWLDALTPTGRMVLPLTATFPAMGPIGKGFMTLLTKASDSDFAARPLTMTAIYSGVGLRDDTMNDLLGKALMRSPFPQFSRLRRDRHETGPACWMHAEGFCILLA